MPLLPIATNFELKYEDSGGDAPVWLLFNGNSLTLEFWGEVADTLAARSRVIRFDQRGVGGTRFEGAFSLLDVAADAARLLESQGSPRVLAVGHAWGGRVAQVFARDYPHMLRALVLCGTGGQFPPRLDAGMQDALRTAAKSGDRTRWQRSLEAMYCAPGYAARDPTDFAQLAEMMWHARSTPRRATWDARIAPSPSYWGTARVPTLLLYGRDDRFGTPDNAEDLARLIPGAALKYFDDAGHFVVREAREHVLDALTSFARTIPTD
jgi:pimeloyl-ACP methyl ester carboxylesterase